MATVRKWANVAVAMESRCGLAGDDQRNLARCDVHRHCNKHLQQRRLCEARRVRYVSTGRQGRARGVGERSNFVAEGVDSTSFAAFSAGTSEKLTFGTSITTATSMSGTGGDFDSTDVTTIHSNVKAQIPGLSNPITYTFDNLWDISDAGQIAMKAATDAQAQKSFKFTFGTGGPITVFLGYVGFTGAPGATRRTR
ncbi:MAG: hypothetical protein IPI27_13405 [Betaproteobacteria bacterium]|nr:hypothetical protein [Betaproteobacteria bacterium]